MSLEGKTLFIAGGSRGGHALPVVGDIRDEAQVVGASRRPPSGSAGSTAATGKRRCR